MNYNNDISANNSFVTLHKSQPSSQWKLCLRNLILRKKKELDLKVIRKLFRYTGI